MLAENARARQSRRARLRSPSAPPEGVLEAQVKVDALLAAARADADGEGDTRHHLKSGREVDGAPDPGGDDQCGFVPAFVEYRHGASFSAPQRFHHEVELRVGEQDQALADERFAGARERRPITPARTHIDVRDEHPAELKARGQVQLESGTAVPATLLLVADRKDDARAWGVRGAGPIAHRDLVAVVQRNVAHA